MTRSAEGLGPSRLMGVATYPLRLGAAGEEWQSTRFGRLAMVNILSSAGDALVVVALAGSIFVSVPLHAARGRTALGLLCTLLPYAVVAPLIGPAADRVRRGKRFVLFLAALGRIAAVLMMAAWLHSLLLFPAAFLSLICSKTHAVARAALVPGSLDGRPDLVRANSRLAMGASVASALAAGAGAAVYALFGSRPVLRVDAFVFAMTAAVCLMVPRPLEDAAPVGQPPEQPPAAHRADRVRRPAALAMAGLRAMAGFLTTLVAFGFRADHAPVIWYGLAAGAAVGGNILGTFLASPARGVVRSDAWLIAVSCVAVALTAGLADPVTGGVIRLAVVAVAASLGVGGTVAKTAFDALVQSGVDDRHRAGAFARYEAGFQGAWVGFALIPALAPVPLGAGLLAVAGLLAGLGLVLAVYLTRARRSARRADG